MKNTLLAVFVATLLLSAGSAMAAATVGKPAPEFSLADLDGKPVKLADFKGKVVVLEWWNPECPFVKAAHGRGSLVGLAKRHTDKGVVWLAINSGAPGKQGAGADKSREGAKAFGMSHPVLLDSDGTVGKAYGATNTPHLFVIGKDGALQYRGAIDNSPDGEGASPQGGKLVNHVAQAIDALAAGAAVPVRETKAYGCSVKYAN